MTQKTITEIRNEFKSTDVRGLSAFISTYSSDERGGVQQLISQAKRKILSYEKELDRVSKMLSFERTHCSGGRIVCGIDEAGRGPLAGPVVAAAVILDINDPILYVNDSKKLSHAKREELFEEIMSRAVSVGIGAASPERIDTINILVQNKCLVHYCRNLAISTFDEDGNFSSAEYGIFVAVTEIHDDYLTGQTTSALAPFRAGQSIRVYFSAAFANPSFPASISSSDVSPRFVYCLTTGMTNRK